MAPVLLPNQDNTATDGHVDATATYLMPASWAQERLWWLDQMEPGSAVHTLPLAVYVRGHLLATALESALQALAERHEVLRTTFRLVDDQPRQVVRPLASTLPTTIDLTNLPYSERPRRARELIEAAIQEPFDLEQGPLLRCLLLRLAADEHQLLVTVHHIVHDGWSDAILWRDLWALYQAAVTGVAATLPALPIQYADFAIWERKQLQGQRLDHLRRFWQSQLADLAGYRALTTDLPRRTDRSRQAARLPYSLANPMAAALGELGRRAGVTLSMLLRAAWSIVLSGYAGHDKIVMTSPSANRDRPETRDLLGYFVNLLVLPVDLGGNPSVLELLARVRQTTLEVYAHQELPTEQIVELMPAPRPPATQLMFGLHHWSTPVTPPPGLTIEPIEIDNGVADVELMLSLVETNGEIAGWLKYDTNLFHASTIQRLLKQLTITLTTMVDRPEQSVAALLGWPQAQSDRAPTAPATPRPTGSRPARDSLEQQLTAIWEQVLNLRSIATDDDFFAVGGDSFRAVRLFTEIERVTGRRLPLALLLKAPTVAHQADLLRQHGWEAPWSSLVALQAAGNRPPLFCFHPNGGNLLSYRALAEHLAPDQPVYGLQACGLDGRTPPLTSVEEMAAHYVAELQSIEPTGPYYLAGYCFGGWLALEVAQQLQARGETIAMLAMFESFAPGYEAELTPRQRLAYQSHWLLNRLRLHASAVVASNATERWAYLAEKARQAGQRLAERLHVTGNPAGGTSLVAAMEHVRAVNTTAQARYRPHRYEGRIILFEVDYRGLADEAERRRGWQRIATEGVTVHRLPGNHYTLLDEPYVATVAARLRELLS